MRTFSLNDSFHASSGRVAYRSDGEGQDMVLVHGTPTNSVIWARVAARLSGRYRLHLLDLPGYGASEKFDGQEVRLRQVAQYDHDYTARLETLHSRMTVPTLILWGEEDAWVDTEVGRRLQTLVPAARFESMPDAGHFSMLDVPGLFARLLDTWLSALPERSAVGRFPRCNPER